MARSPVMAAGGIVLRPGQTPLVAVVRLRKRNEWVLPKGKLDDGETPRAAAEREVVEETGHDVAVHEFLGTLVYESRGGSKVVHYWRMEARGGPAHELMRDVRAVDWLPLDAAVDRLSRDYERAFLENVGPIALSAAAHAASARRARAKLSPEKRRPRRPDVTAPPVVAPAPSAPLPDQLSPVIEHDDVPVAIDAAAGTSAGQGLDLAAQELQPAEPESFAPEIEPVAVDAAESRTRWQPRSFIQKLRDWLRRDT
jgi:8-oxo-dGTP diphosphatase